MRNMLTYILVMVSMMKVVGLLQWNTTSDIQITEFRATLHFRMYTDL